jgi:hypothetical protein
MRDLPAFFFYAYPWGPSAGVPPFMDPKVPLLRPLVWCFAAFGKLPQSAVDPKIILERRLNGNSKEFASV